MLMVLCIGEKDLTNEQTLLCDTVRGPLWYRGLATTSPNCDKVEKMLKVIGARRIVVGHTPNERVCPGVCPDT